MDNYLQPVNNHFDLNRVELEDVDDDIFLSNSRNNDNATAGASGGRAAGGRRSTNPFEDQEQIYADKRREIEERSLESTQRSLGLLYETEEVGKATALELAKQREQLEKTAHQLDEINSTLRFSQRHLNGLKSVFGGLKNYLSGNRDTQSPRMSTSPSGGDINSSADNIKTPNMRNPPNDEKGAGGAMSPTEIYDNHPVSRIRDDSSNYHQREQQQLQRRNNPFEVQLEANLEEMCGNLSRLKFLATDLGSEIESQNEILDNMNYKLEDVDLKMTKQNKDINKLLGKK